MTDPVQISLTLVIGCLIGMGIFIAQAEVGRDDCENPPPPHREVREGLGPRGEETVTRLPLAGLLEIEMKDSWIATAIIWGLFFAGAGFVWLRSKWRVSRLRVGAYYTIEPNDPFGASATVVLLEMRGGWCSYKFWSKKHGLMDGRSSAKASTFAAIYTRIPTPLEHKP